MDARRDRACPGRLEPLTAGNFVVHADDLIYMAEVVVKYWGYWFYIDLPTTKSRGPRWPSSRSHCKNRMANSPAAHAADRRQVSPA